MLDTLPLNQDVLQFGSLFTGIGGIDLGLERANLKLKWQCEIHPFCRQVLNRRWPKTLRFTDIKYVERNGYCENIDLLVGGFPCQPISLVGQRAGYHDPRWLWPEFRRIIQDLEPKYILIENVEGLRTSGLTGILRDLAADGYDAEWDCLPAALLGAPHIRKRYFIVGYPIGFVRNKKAAILNFKTFKEWALTHFVSDVTFDRLQESGAHRLPASQWYATNSDSPIRGFGWWSIEPRMGRMVNGVSCRLDRHKALGNSVIPQLAEFIGYGLNKLEAS